MLQVYNQSFVYVRYFWDDLFTTGHWLPSSLIFNPYLITRTDG